MKILLTILCVSLTRWTLANNATTGRNISRDCVKYYSSTCLKLDIVTFIEKLSENNNYPLIPGINLVRDQNVSEMKTSDLVAELARDFPNDAEARLNGFLIKKVVNYLSSHSIRFKLLDKSSVNNARNFWQSLAIDSLEQQRGKKTKGLTHAIIAGLMMIKGTLLPLAMGTLAMLAGKALLTGLLSLMLSTIIGLRALTRGGAANLTYEIVSKPVYTQAHTHSTAHEDHAGYTYAHARNFMKKLSEVPKEQLTVDNIKVIVPSPV